MILPGLAHLDSTPFNNRNPWGYAGMGWRYNRQFVGRLSYGARYLMWTPQDNVKYPSPFQQMVLTLLMCNRRAQSPLSIIPHECLLYILNMCK